MLDNDGMFILLSSISGGVKEKGIRGVLYKWIVAYGVRTWFAGKETPLTKLFHHFIS